MRGAFDTAGRDDLLYSGKSGFLSKKITRWIFLSNGKCFRKLTATWIERNNGSVFLKKAKTKRQL